uniref:Np15 n=1 Tax=Stichopus japonicus TaxID=307972 RepID=A0A2Z4C051_STIJA|nr:np15 precursor [Apostichopus japonicus]
MSQLSSVCLLLVLLSVTVYAYPADQAGNLLDLDELFQAQEIPVDAPENMPFGREQKRLGSATCRRECAYCAKIHTRYSLGRCFRTCMTGKTDYSCANRMHFV